MFIALRELKVAERGNPKVTLIRPGEEVPNFDKWDHAVKMAHLNLEYVQEVEAKSEKKASPTSAPKKAPAKPVQTLKKAAPKTEKFRCEEHGKDFKSAKALKTHTTLAHKK